MKSSLRVTFIMAICIFMQSAHAQVSNPDTMIHRIFSTLKAKDQKAYVALYPNGEQFGRFMRNIMEQTFKSEEMKKMMEMDEKSKNMNVDSMINAQVKVFSDPKQLAQIQQAFGSIFQKIIKKGEKEGINWSEAKLVGYTIDSSEAMGESGFFQPKGLKFLKGVIDFTVNDSAYQLAYDKVIFLQDEGGWFGGEFTQLARKGESLAPDAAETMEIEPVEVPVQQKKATKPKGKASTAKTKVSGTKAPARKPKA